MSNGLDTLLSSSLRVRVGESVAFIYDGAFEPLVTSVREYCADRDIQLSQFSTQYDGIGPLPEHLREVLLGPQFGVIVFGVVHNIWHTPERKHAKYILKKRLASIVCSPDRLNEYKYASSIPSIALATRQLSDLFLPGAAVRIRSPGGSEFTAEVGTPFCEHGEYGEPGSGGDFPAGEAGFGPRESSVHGRIVYDVKVQHLGILYSPLALVVENDQIKEVSGPYRQAFLELCERRGRMLNYISEVSLGLNPFVGVTPELEFIPEEKTFGTAHCGHGGNASYGHRVGPHIDGVIAAPTVEIDGRCVMRSGKLVQGSVQGNILEWLENNPKC